MSRDRRWPLLVRAAALRQGGATQAEAAEAVGVSERTLRRWETNETLWTRATEADGDPRTARETRSPAPPEREPDSRTGAPANGTGQDRTTGQPRSWELWVSAAYLRIIGATQAQAGAAVGRSERTIQDWEADPQWENARAEARSRWLADVDDRARARILEGLAPAPEDPLAAAKLGLALLERLDPAMAPAARKVDIRLGVVERLMQLPSARLLEIEEMSDDEVAGLLTAGALDG